MKKVLIAVIYGLLFITACSKKEETTLTEVQIRVKNMSNLNYTDLTVSTGGGQQNYGTLNSQSLSDYKTYQYCYRYGFIQLKIDGRTYSLQPIDYVGEIKFESGKFTYEIDANTINNSLSLNFVKD